MLLILVSLFVFVFKQKTAYEMRISDWSSDVCSSDLGDAAVERPEADRDRRPVRDGEQDDREPDEEGDDPGNDTHPAPLVTLRLARHVRPLRGPLDIST